MKNKIYPCLWFDGQAKAAADLYCSVFSNSRITVDTPMVVNFELNGQKFMGLNGGPAFQPNPSISFYVVYENEIELDKAWYILSEGGAVMMPLNKYPWSEKYGWLKDPFGITWQLTLDKTGSIGQKITPSMLFTEGVHGRGNEAVDFYISVFPNSATAMKAFYQEGQNEYATAGMILFSNFKLIEQSFIIMDAGAPQAYTFNEGISYVIDCENQEETDYFWNKLTEGGQESMCGWLKDKFGVSWQIVPRQLMQLMGDKDAEKSKRVMQAMFKMKKIVIADLEKAYNNTIVR